MQFKAANVIRIKIDFFIDVCACCTAETAEMEA